MAVEDDLAIVGAPDAGAGDRGAVHVYEHGASGWVQVARFEGQEDGAHLGAAVDVSGGELLAGAPGASAVGGEGVAFHYIGSGASWTVTPLVATSSLAAHGVGGSVAFDADRVVLGAAGDDGRGASTGAVHVFVR